MKGASLAEALFRLAILAYSAGFRRRWGDEMTTAFRDSMAARRRAGRGTTGYLIRALADAVRSGVGERFRGGPGTRDRRVGRRGMGVRMGELAGDVRLAARTLARTPGFTLAAVMVMALGVGANAAVFSAVRTVLLDPPPFPEAERLVFLDLSDSSRVEPGPPRATAWSWPKYRMLAEAEDRLADPVAAFASRSLVLTGAGDPVVLPVEVVTPDYFRVLGAEPLQGRGLQEADDGPDAPPVALLGHELWRTRFGGDAGVVGRSITLEGREVTVLGIAPPGFAGMTGTARLWIPVHTAAALTRSFLVESAQAHWLRAVGRLPRGAALPALEERMRALGSRVEERYPGDDPDVVQVVATQSLARARVSREGREALTLLLLASGLLLLTACANLAGLLTARASTRERELAVRRALGAGRWRVARTLLVESLLLAAAGGVAAVAVAHLGVRALATAWPERFLSGSWNVGFVRPEAMAVDGVVLGYALAVAVVCGLIFGLVPAVVFARRDPARGLGSRFDHAGSRGHRGGGSRVRKGLVGLEVAFALVLVVGAGLMTRSLQELGEVDRGFEGGNVLTFSLMAPRSSAVEEDPAVVNEALLERIAGLPGVASASVSCALPLQGHCWIGVVRRAGDRSWQVGDQPRVGVNPVGPGWFGALGVPVLRGRAFSQDDRSDTPPVAVISESAARILFPGADPLGQTVNLSASLTPEDGPGARVVGVVGDVLFDRPDQGTLPGIYLSHRQEAGAGNFVVRTTGDPMVLVPELRGAVASLAPGAALQRIRTLQDSERSATGDTRLLGSLLGVFALLALLLAATGVWAIVAFSVTRRTRELGVRMALGARADQLVGRVVRDDLLPVAAGLALGLVGAWGASRLLENLLYGVDPWDPVTFTGATVVLLIVGVAAAWLPARRATRLEPVEALRSD